MNTKSKIVTSAADGCGKPSSIRPMDNLPSRDHKGAEYKESFMFSNRSTISRGCSLAAATLAAVACIGLASTASASTIYSDSFPGSSSATLNGTTPATDTTGATWTADTAWNADGSLNASIVNNYKAYLPFAPANGQIYTLSEGINATSNISGFTGGWIGLFFEPSGTFISPTTGAPNGGPAILDDVPNSMSEIVTLTGPGTSGSPNFNLPYSGSGIQNLQMVLNTGGAYWSVQFSDNGTVLGYYSYSSTNPNPSIADVGFNSQGANGQVSNFSLTSSAVPEPATLGLFAIGGIGLLLAARRRKTQV